MTAIEAPPPNRRRVAEIPDFAWPRRHQVCELAYMFWSPAGKLVTDQTARGAG